jgi:hypothetical protein
MKVYQQLALGAALFSFQLLAGTRIKVEDLPKPVLTALQKMTQGATVLGASKEKENGRMTYEVETKVDGKSRDLTFDATGALLEVEQEVAIDGIPTAAREAIEKRAGGGVIAKVESVSAGSQVSYEADIKGLSGKKMEVAVNADGSAHKE